MLGRTLFHRCSYFSTKNKNFVAFCELFKNFVAFFTIYCKLRKKYLRIALARKEKWILSCQPCRTVCKSERTLFFSFSSIKFFFVSSTNFNFFRMFFVNQFQFFFFFNYFFRCKFLTISFCSWYSIIFSSSRKIFTKSLILSKKNFCCLDCLCFCWIFQFLLSVQKFRLGFGILNQTYSKITLRLSGRYALHFENFWV